MPSLGGEGKAAEGNVLCRPPGPPESNSRRWTPSHCDEACWYPQAHGRECEKGSLKAKPAKCFLEKQQALWNMLSPLPRHATLASARSTLSNGETADYKRLSCICLYFQQTHVQLSLTHTHKAGKILLILFLKKVNIKL